MKKLSFLLALLLGLFLCAPAFGLTLRLPDSLTEIQASAFEGDTSIEKVKLPDGIKRIGSKAFADSSATSINLPSALKPENIADDAFAGCGSLVVELDENSPLAAWCDAHGIQYHVRAKPLPDEYFQFTLLYDEFGDDSYEATKYIGPESVSNIVIPSEYNGLPVREIGSRFLSLCPDYQGGLTIPPSVEKINSYAFHGCKGLTGDLVIPDSVSYINDYAFYGCSGFTGSLTLDSGVWCIGYSAFQGCSGFTGSLTLGPGVGYIGHNAFQECSGFTGSLTLGSDVWYIGSSAFQGCSHFTGSLTIGSDVWYIGSGAFQGCSGFTGNLVLSKNLESIGARAFSSCTGFTGKLELPDSLTFIGNSAFSSCTGFTGKLELPNSLTFIGESAFSYCTGFTGDLVIPDNVRTIDSYAFRGCEGFDGRLIFGKNINTIGALAFVDTHFTGDLVIPGSLKTIGKNAFRGCSGFDGTLTIEDGVQSIGTYAFSDCSGFKGDLILPDSVESIGANAFLKCSGFDGQLRLSNKLTSIESYTFSRCSGLRGDLIIPDSVKTIAPRAFFFCSGFDGQLRLSNRLTSIESGAFELCSRLTGSLILPESLEKVESGAFSDCEGFTDAYVLSPQTEFGYYVFYKARGSFVAFGEVGSTIQQKAQELGIRFYPCPATCLKNGHTWVTDTLSIILTSETEHVHKRDMHCSLCEYRRRLTDTDPAGCWKCGFQTGLPETSDFPAEKILIDDQYSIGGKIYYGIRLIDNYRGIVASEESSRLFFTDSQMRVVRDYDTLHKLYLMHLFYGNEKESLAQKRQMIEGWIAQAKSDAELYRKIVMADSVIGDLAKASGLAASYLIFQPMAWFNGLSGALDTGADMSTETLAGMLMVHYSNELVRSLEAVGTAGLQKYDENIRRATLSWEDMEELFEYFAHCAGHHAACVSIVRETIDKMATDSLGDRALSTLMKVISGGVSGASGVYANVMKLAGDCYSGLDSGWNLQSAASVAGDICGFFAGSASEIIDGLKGCMAFGDLAFETLFDLSAYKDEYNRWKNLYYRDLAIDSALVDAHQNFPAN